MSRIEDLEATLKRVVAEYGGDPNIETVGFGLRQRGGEFGGERAIVFYVRSKYPSERQIRAAGSRPIPGEIEGYPTDVQTFVVRRAQAAGNRDETQYDPLLGGPRSSNAEGHIYWFNSAGTLGILVRDAADGSPMALSNWHVWADGGDVGDDIIQPGHPTGGDHVEATAKVALCGPLLTSLIEWEVPSPLTWGLYGGAAAAAIAAAASDYRDPTRRGQDHTTPDPGELTLGETVEMKVDYQQLPLPGKPFSAGVKWNYARRTPSRTLTYEAEETRTNTQFLLGKVVATDRTSYGPGDRITLDAVIWDHQPRPCDAYHVVAHLIPHARPSESLRVVLHPAACRRGLPTDPPDTEPGAETCLSFEEHKIGGYPPAGVYRWLTWASSEDRLDIVDWHQNTPAARIPARGLTLGMPPARRVTATVATYHSRVQAAAYNAAGQILDQKNVPHLNGEEQEVVLEGDGIVRLVLSGGGGEAVLLRICMVPATERFVTSVPASVAEGIELEHLTASRPTTVRSSRCCFRGSIPLPPDEPPGKWDVYLTVQNINHVPGGTPPDQAATVIGGHLLSSHSSELVGCLVVMLLDHAFDVI